MKYLLLLPVVATAFLASSCRTVVPIDPMTMKQSCRCLPGQFIVRGPCDEVAVIGTK